ncbi:MAG: hypothetical protein J1E62_06200, partial [Lachnospiraceae bacterium]|nr:hypothetical protein [Lachnospiraceae bacterium]
KYKCKITVKAKKKTTPKPSSKTTPKPTGSSGGSSGGNGGSSGGGTRPGVITPPPTETPSGGGGSTPTIPPEAEGTPVPVITPEPSEEDSLKTDITVDLNTSLDESKGTVWNRYRKNLGQVPAEEGDTVTIDCTSALDSRLDWINTHGKSLSMEELQAHESAEYVEGGEGQFWEHHCRKGDIIDLDLGMNTIYVRLTVLDIKDNIIGVQYMNTDNIVVKIKESQQPTPTPTGGGSGGGGTTTDPTPTPAVGTGSRGEDVTLESWRSTFTVKTDARDYKFTLGMSADDVKKVLGNYSLDVRRYDGKSPQGFDVMAFRQDGKYNTYILVYLKNSKVVGITAIGKNVSYGDIVQTGTTASSLESSGWYPVDWYTTKGSKAAAGAYSKDNNEGHVLAFVDYYGDKTTYCIQVFSWDYSIDSMTDVSKNTSLDYTTSVLSEMKTECGEMINAYLAYYGVRTLSINSTVSSVAQEYCADLKNIPAMDSTQADRGSLNVKSALTAKGLKFNAWGERVMIGNMDAIGAVNAVVQSEDARTQIRDTGFKIMGLGTDNYDNGSQNTPYLVIDFIDFSSNM